MVNFNVVFLRFISCKNLAVWGDILYILSLLLLMPELFSKVLSVAVYNHYNRLRLASLKKNSDQESVKGEDEDEDDSVEPEKSNILLLGPTGSGMNTIESLVNIRSVFSLSFY